MGLAGIPSLQGPLVSQMKKISSLERRDVYCFGLVLYEVAVGQAYVHNTDSDATDGIREVAIFGHC